MAKKIYIKAKDGNSSFSILGQDVVVGGLENKPVEVNLTPEVRRALYGRAVIEVHKSDLKKEDIDLKKEDIDLKKEDIDLKKEDIDLKKEVYDLIKRDDYAEMLDFAKAKSMDVKGNISKKALVTLLTNL